MEEVVFHFNVADRLDFACRLLRKAYRAGATVGVLCDEAMLPALDVALWSFAAQDFIPHCRAEAAPVVRGQTPIVLARDVAALGQRDVLLQLQAQVPPGADRFGRVIELVGRDAADRQAARVRWREYSQRGCKIVPHDHQPRS